MCVYRLRFGQPWLKRTGFGLVWNVGPACFTSLMFWSPPALQDTWPSHGKDSGWRDQGQQHNSSVFCAMMVIEQTHSTGMGWPRKGTEKRLRNMKAYYFTQARILELFAISFSRRSSWQRDWTWVSHIAGRFFTIWVAMKPPCYTTASRKRTHSWPRRAPWGSWGGLRKQEGGGNHG